MRRRTFLSTLPAGALLAGATAATAAGAPAPAAAARPRQTAPADPYAGIGPGNRNSGVQFVGRSTVWGANGAAATAHPRATLIGIDTLRRGGSAIDAAIAINAALGFLEPTANGIGGDAFCMLWDPAQRKVVGFNGAGNSPQGLSLATARSKARLASDCRRKNSTAPSILAISSPPFGTMGAISPPSARRNIPALSRSRRRITLPRT